MTNPSINELHWKLILELKLKVNKILNINELINRLNQYLRTNNETFR